MKYYQSKPRLLFLYTELAGYFIACLKKLYEINDVEILVIHWNINNEAPFHFSFPENIEFCPKNSFNFNQLSEKVKSFNPDFIYCSGWIDKDYLKVISTFKKRIPTVIALDTPWQNRLRQYVACVISRFTLLKIFTHCWATGERQKKYALKLGFKKKNIILGMYSADVEYYNRIGLNCKDEKSRHFPKRFIYVGRYSPSKGLLDLWAAFKQWKHETGGEWELWCLGTGDIKPMESDGISHFGFVQPADMEKFIKETGIFILPSHFEPWGVALHEYTAAGFPVICSDNVCATEKFVQNGKNGFIYPSGNIQELKACIRTITQKNDKELMQMGELSRQLSQSITPLTWSKNIMNLLSDNKNERK